MGLSQALSNAYSGLSANSRKTEVAAHNIANSTTPGFLRREVNLEAQQLAGEGQGVLFTGTTLATSALTSDRREADADYAYQEVIAEAAQSHARIIGDSDDPGSLFSRFQEFEAAISSLAETPDSQQLQLDAYNRAADVVTEINQAQADNLQIREDADREIARQVDELNALLSEFEKLNENIEKFSYRGEEITELAAEREQLLDAISKFVPVEAIERDGNRVALMTPTGFTLVDANAAEIGFTASNVVAPSMDYIAEAAAAPPAPTLSGLTIRGLDVTPPEQYGNALGGGSLGAQFQVRDVTTVDFQTSIDALASDLIGRFDYDATNVVDATLTVGDPGLFTDAQATDTGVVGLAGRLELNSAVDPSAGTLWRLRDGMNAVAEGDSGDNTTLVAMLNALSTRQTAPNTGISGTLSAIDLAAQFSSKYSTLSFDADTTLALRSNRLESLSQQEQAQTGVDLDYELQNLNLIQTAYTANARVMEVVDQLMRRLMEI